MPGRGTQVQLQGHAPDEMEAKETRCQSKNERIRYSRKSVLHSSISSSQIVKKAHGEIIPTYLRHLFLTLGTYLGTVKVLAIRRTYELTLQAQVTQGIDKMKAP